MQPRPYGATVLPIMCVSVVRYENPWQHVVRQPEPTPIVQYVVRARPHHGEDLIEDLPRVREHVVQRTIAALGGDTRVALVHRQRPLPGADERLAAHDGLRSTSAGRHNSATS